MKLNLRLFPVITILAVLLTAFTHAKADVVSDWNLIAVQTISAEMPARPAPVWFLDLALVHISMHDAIQSIDKRFEPYHVPIPGAMGSPEVAAAKAAHDMLVHLFPGQAGALGMIFNNYLVAHTLSPNDAGVAVGASAAAGIIALRANDGRFPPNQVPFNGGTNPGEWRPTPSLIGMPPAPPSFASMVTPWVANVTPFVIKSGDQFRAPAPPPLKSKRYAKSYDDVRLLGARFNSDRTTDQTNLALLWASNYAVLWSRVLREIADAHLTNVDDSGRLFALSMMAIADSIITSWDSKVAFNTWRPITAIRLGDSDTNPDTIGVPNWEPLVNTPNYPDVTSGANNVTGAVTRTLSLYFGNDEMLFTVRTTNAAAPQQTKDYFRFSDAADDVVRARVYEGIHFDFADEEARKQGRHVAQRVFSHALKPLD